MKLLPLYCQIALSFCLLVILGKPALAHQPIMDMAPRWQDGYGFQIRQEYRSSDKLFSGSSEIETPLGLDKTVNTTWLALFTTTGTLLCCALPITLVALGMGATMASLVSSVPFLVTLSEHKEGVFAVSGALLAISTWLMYRPERTCPTDPTLNSLCSKSQVWNRRIIWFSIALWCLGFFAAFLALPLQIWLDRL